MGCFGSSKSANQVYSTDTAMRLRAGNMPYIVLMSKAVGKGIKASYAWETQWSKEDVAKKQEIFWNTRVEGKPETWAILRQILEEPNEQNSHSMFMGYGLKAVKGLSITEDLNGFQYNLPYYIMSNPISTGTENNAVIYPDEILIVCRYLGSADFHVKVDANEKFEGIKRRVAQTIGRDESTVSLKINNENIEDAETPEHLNIGNLTIVEVVSKNK